MEPQQIQSLTCTFEGHAQRTETGVEYWLARDLQHLLGYGKWDNFQSVISKAKTACELSGHAIADHFADVGKMIELGKGDQALFGKSTQAMKAQWQVPDTRPLADFAPTIILKAKDFATEITIHNARTQQMQSEQQISSEHVTNNEAVRQTLLNRGIRPENLLPEEDVKKWNASLPQQKKRHYKIPINWKTEKPVMNSSTVNSRCIAPRIEEMQGEVDTDNTNLWAAGYFWLNRLFNFAQISWCDLTAVILCNAHWRKTQL